MQFFQLTFVYGCWRINHNIPTAIVFGERDKITNGFLAS